MKSMTLLGCALTFFLLTSGLLAPSVAAAPKVVKEYRSLYRNITVVENPPQRCIRLENKKNPYNSQSCLVLNNPRELLFFYSQAMFAVLSTLDDGFSVLSVGLGGGTMPTALHSYFSNVDVTTVEIDPKMLEAAKDFMFFVEAPRNAVVIQDARFYIRKQGQKGAQYDVVMLDAFNGEYIPEHLTTQEFLQEVKKVLKPGGLLLSNTFSYKDFYHSESVTYESVFPDFCMLRSAGVRTIVAYNGLSCDAGKLRKEVAANLENLKPYIPFPGFLPDAISNDKNWDPTARLFTDQFSPANLYNTP